MFSATWIEVQGSQVYVEVAGVGQTVLCIHTAGQSGVQYRNVLQELPAYGYQVIVLDLPGHGRSAPAPNGPITDLHLYAEICWDVLRALDVTSAIVVGCSIGGKIVLDLCVNHGAELRAGVAMEANAYSGQLSVAGLRRSMSDEASPSQGDRTFFGTLASVGTAVSRERADDIAQVHRREDSAITSSDLIGWTTHDLRGRLSEVACPLLVVAGSDDFWVTMDDCRDVATSVPRGCFKELSGIGHYPMEEMADFSNHLAQWLGELSVSRLPE